MPLTYFGANRLRDVDDETTQSQGSRWDHQPSTSTPFQLPGRLRSLVHAEPVPGSSEFVCYYKLLIDDDNRPASSSSSVAVDEASSMNATTTFPLLCSAAGCCPRECCDQQLQKSNKNNRKQQQKHGLNNKSLWRWRGEDEREELKPLGSNNVLHAATVVAANDLSMATEHFGALPTVIRRPVAHPSLQMQSQHQPPPPPSMQPQQQQQQSVHVVVGLLIAFVVCVVLFSLTMLGAFTHNRCRERRRRDRRRTASSLATTTAGGGGGANCDDQLSCSALSERRLPQSPGFLVPAICCAGGGGAGPTGAFLCAQPPIVSADLYIKNLSANAGNVCTRSSYGVGGKEASRGSGGNYGAFPLTTTNTLPKLYHQESFTKTYAGSEQQQQNGYGYGNRRTKFTSPPSSIAANNKNSKLYANLQQTRQSFPSHSQDQNLQPILHESGDERYVR